MRSISCGLPDVVKTQPRLEDGTPFPTLYYLTCPAATSASRSAYVGVQHSTVARVSAIVSSQRKGLCKNAAGESSTPSPPLYSVSSKPPIKR